jgi:hypothetical protein
VGHEDAHAGCALHRLLELLRQLDQAQGAHAGLPWASPATRAGIVASGTAAGRRSAGKGTPAGRSGGGRRRTSDPSLPATTAPGQVGAARAALRAQVATPDAGADWRHRLPPEALRAVAPDARGMGTMEGTNAHLLTKRMKKKGMAWTVPGACRLAKVRELVANGALAPWCHRPAGPPPFAPGAPRHPADFAPRGPLPWPRRWCPAARGPLTDPVAAILHRIDTGGRHRLL